MMLLLASDIEDESWSWLVLMEESDMSETPEDLVRLESEELDVEESCGLVP